MSGIVTLAIFISAVCAGSPLFSLRTGPEAIIYGVSSSTTSTLCSPSSSPSPARSSPVRISPEALEDRHLFDVRVLRLDRAGLANEIFGYDRWNWGRRRSRCGLAKPCNISRNAEVSRRPVVGNCWSLRQRVCRILLPSGDSAMGCVKVKTLLLILPLQTNTLRSFQQSLRQSHLARHCSTHSITSSQSKGFLK